MCDRCIPPDGIVLILPGDWRAANYHESRLRAMYPRPPARAESVIDGVLFPQAPDEYHPVVRSLAGNGHRADRYVIEEINGRLRVQIGGGTQ